LKTSDSPQTFKLVFIDEDDVWVYEAIRGAQEHLGVFPADLAEPAHQVESGSLNAFVSQALGNVEFVSPDRPTIALDIPAGALVSGSFSETDGVIHLQAGGLDRWIILHELAHWMNPTDRHGEAWREQFTQLVRIAISERAAEGLTDAFKIWKPVVPGTVQFRSPSFSGGQMEQFLAEREE
jgi:hypothetical protein